MKEKIQKNRNIQFIFVLLQKINRTGKLQKINRKDKLQK